MPTSGNLQGLRGQTTLNTIENNLSAWGRGGQPGAGNNDVK
jgi:hypothetical protein